MTGKCPECTRKITYLIHRQSGINETRFHKNRKGDVIYKQFDDWLEPQEEETLFFCPECEELIAEDEDEALELLYGKKDD